MNWVRNLIAFIYISVIVHLYLGLGFMFVQQQIALQETAQRVKPEKKEPEVENIIVETVESTVKEQTEGKLSDKANIDSGLIKGDKKYNYFNPRQDKRSDGGPVEVERVEVQKSPQFEVNPDFKGDPGPKDNNTQEKAQPSQKQSAEPSPSLLDPYQKIEVSMDNTGNLSLSTVPEESADYFLKMQKKIGSSWGLFFPIFQYYQGIIRNGDVIIQFDVDSKGNVQNPVISKSYGYSILDEACLNAVIYSKNFGPLPDKLKKMKSVRVNFRFIYIGR